MSFFSKELLNVMCLTIALLFLFIFIYHYQFSRFFIIFCFTGFATILLFNRIVFNLLVISLRSRFKMAKNVVVLGYNEVSKRLIDYFQKEAKLVKLAGCFDDKGEIEDAAVLCRFLTT